MRKSKLHPYTKNNIDNKIIQKLKLFINYNNIELKSNNFFIELNWNTTQQAYTDVVYYMEKIGFYNNILWFNELTYGNVLHIIHIYQNLTNNINININYKFFDENVINEIDNNNYQYKFAKEIINLFINGNDHFILCCNFVKALAIVSNKFYNNIPEWLTNITTDILFNNNFAIYLNNSDRMLMTNVNENNENNVNNENNNIIDMQLENIIDPSTIYYILDMLNRNN